MRVLLEQTENTLGMITYYTKLKFGFLVIRENLVSSFSFVVPSYEQGHRLHLTVELVT